jgi:hypothetical protein
MKFRDHDDEQGPKKRRALRDARLAMMKLRRGVEELPKEKKQRRGR